MPVSPTTKAITTEFTDFAKGIHCTNMGIPGVDWSMYTLNFYDRMGNEGFMLYYTNTHDYYIYKYQTGNEILIASGHNSSRRIRQFFTKFVEEYANK